MIPTRAWRAMHNLFVRGLLALIAAVDMEAGAIEMREGRCKARALGSRGGNEAVECRHPIGVERIEGTPERIIVEMAGFYGWRDQEQPFPAKAYAIENKRLVPSGFRKHKVNRINNICILCH